MFEQKIGMRTPARLFLFLCSCSLIIRKTRALVRIAGQCSRHHSWISGFIHTSLRFCLICSLLCDCVLWHLERARENSSRFFYDWCSAICFGSKHWYYEHSSAWLRVLFFSYSMTFSLRNKIKCFELFLTEVGVLKGFQLSLNFSQPCLMPISSHVFSIELLYSITSR